MSGKQTDSLLAWLRDYGERRINSRLIDERRSLTPNIVLDFGNAGMFGLQVPRAYGGLGMGHRDALRVYVQLAAIDPTIASFVFLHNTNGLRPILQHATDAMKDELLPLLARGRELAAFALSEPGAGSHLAGLETQTTASGTAWRIDGTKRWNGSAWSGVISVFARMVDDAGRPRGLTGFIVRQTDPGVVIGPESLTMGIRGIIQNSVDFHGVRVTADRMLGSQGAGMVVVTDVLAHGRLAAAAVALGIAFRAMQLTLRYTRRRTVDTGLLIDNPQTSVAMSDVTHRIDLDHALLMRAAERLDAGDIIVPEVAMAIKVCSTETSFSAADLAVQLLGGRGYMETNIAPQLFRDARMLTIGEGANESLLGAIGRAVRMSDALSRYLLDLEPAGTIARRLGGFVAALEEKHSAGPFSGDAARIWHDAELGRASIAALRLAASAGRTPEAIAWATTQFETALASAQRDAPALATALSVTDLGQRIGAYAETIGDVEPLAPDIDFALDPMLQREPAGGVVAPPDVSLKEKRERLRSLLLDKQPSGAPRES